MSTILHDLRCQDCDTLAKNVAIEAGKPLPACPLCAGPTAVSWEHGKPPATDVYGQKRWNEGTGRFESSSRTAEKFMQKQGYDGHAGDPVHGARKEHKLLKTGFSYAGQGSRVSTGERA